MSALTGQKIKDSYKDLLQISNSNSGLDSTLRPIEDGEGTVSALYVSTSQIKVTGQIAAEFETNVDIELGRGVTDTDITYIAIRNANGDMCYIYPSDTGKGIKVSTTKP